MITCGVLLFTTGYLTKCGQDDGVMTSLVIPNKEIRWIFKEQIQEWLQQKQEKIRKCWKYSAGRFEENDAAAIEKGFTSYLRKTISIRDNNVRKEMKEKFLPRNFAGIIRWYGWMESQV